MTDLSNLPPEVRKAIEQFDFIMHEDIWKTLRDYILRITAEKERADAFFSILEDDRDEAFAARDRAIAERDALAKRIADAPTVKEGDYIGTVLEALDNAIHGGKRVALVKVDE
jgi:hypothetical protein